MMQDIDKLMREHLKDATQQPPEGTWDEIMLRMNSVPVMEPAPRRGARWPWVTAALAAAVVTTALLWPRHEEQSHPSSVEVAEVTVEKVWPAEDMSLKDNPEQTMPVSQEQHNAGQVSGKTVAKTPSRVASSGKDAEVNAPVHDIPAAVASAVAVIDERPQASVPQGQRPARQETQEDKTAAMGKSAAVVASDKETSYEADRTSVASAVSQSMSTTSTVTRPASSGADKSVLPEITIPNIISPNGDGVNDCWAIPDIHQFGQVQVQVFTAKGKRVFHSDNYADDFCGNGLPDGNYFYILVIKEKEYSRRGVLVIRR